MKRVEGTAEKVWGTGEGCGVLRVVCLLFVSLFFLFYHMIFTFTFDVVCVKDKGSCV